MRITLATVLTLIVTALVAPTATAAGPELVLKMVEVADRCVPTGTVVTSPTIVATRGGEPVSGLEVKWSTFRADGDIRNVGAVTGADGRSTAPFDAVTLSDSVEFYVRAVDSEWHSFREATATVRATGREREGGSVSQIDDQAFSGTLYASAFAPTELAADADGTCRRAKTRGARLEVSMRPATEQESDFTAVGGVDLPADYSGRAVEFQTPTVGTWQVESRITIAGEPYRTVKQDVEVLPDPVTMFYEVTRSTEGRHGVWFTDRRGHLEVWVAAPDPRSSISLRAPHEPESLSVGFTDALTGRRTQLPAATLEKHGNVLSATIDHPPITRRGRFDVSTAGAPTVSSVKTSVDVRPRPVLALPRRSTKATDDQLVRRRIHVKDGRGLVLRLMGAEKRGGGRIASKAVRIPASGWVTVTVPRFSGTYVFNAEVCDLSSRGTGWCGIASTPRTWTVTRR